MAYSRSVGFMRRMHWGLHRDSWKRGEIRRAEHEETRKIVEEETVLIPRCSRCGSPDHDDSTDNIDDLDGFAEAHYTTETPK